MLHDYIHFFLCDLLRENGVGFLTDRDLKQDVAPKLSELLKDLTPDLIVFRPKERPLWFDVYVGGDDISTIKSKYRQFLSLFEFVIITPANVVSCKQLQPLISSKRLNALFSNYQIFKTEYHYWMSCVKMREIIRNECRHVPEIKVV